MNNSDVNLRLSLTQILPMQCKRIHFLFFFFPLLFFPADGVSTAAVFFSWSSEFKGTSSFISKPAIPFPNLPIICTSLPTSAAFWVLYLSVTPEIGSYVLSVNVAGGGADVVVFSAVFFFSETNITPSPTTVWSFSFLLERDFGERWGIVYFVVIRV